MTSQQTLDGRPPADAGLWRTYVTDGNIDHHAWMRACSQAGWVGTCRRCGDYLRPERPDDRGAGRTDYLARCRDPACGYELVAPGGRINTRRRRGG